MNVSGNIKPGTKLMPRKATKTRKASKVSNGKNGPPCVCFSKKQRPKLIYILL